MSEHTESFIAHLIALEKRDRGALATLRHSLAFEPGTYVKAFPHVERFTGVARHERDPYRLALYLGAGLFARHPHTHERSFATALGELMRKRESQSIEGRFVALLSADAENIAVYLRQAISLLASDNLGLNYANLLRDLSVWLNPNIDPSRLRQQWARDFYRAVAPIPAESTDTE